MDKRRTARNFDKAEINDIGWPLNSEIIEFDGRKILQFEPMLKEIIITMVNHTVTHVNAPKYFFPQVLSLDVFGLKRLIGRC